MTNLHFLSPGTRIEFSRDDIEAQRQILERLYERRARVEALIQSLEEYARCRSAFEVTLFPDRKN